MKAIAEEGFIYGLPIVMNYAVMLDYVVDRYSGQFKAPCNQIHNEARVFTYKDTAIVTSNSDKPCCLLWMDLRAEPMAVSVPEVKKTRYYCVQLIVGNTFTSGYIGSRATGHEAGSYMVVGPGWIGEKPAGIRQVFRSSTEFSLAVYRTQLFDPADMPNVAKVQAGYKAQPLPAYLKQPPPAAVADIDCPKIDKELLKTNFFDYLNFVLQSAPASSGEEERGSAPGWPAPALARPSASRIFRQSTGRPGRAQVEEYLATGDQTINGWKVGSFFCVRACCNGDWHKRAAVAKGGIDGNAAAEARYPLSRTMAS